MTEVWELPGSRFDSSPRSIAVIPIGSVERHGDHLPLGTDAIEAAWVAQRVADALGADLFPTIWYGVSPALARFPGTINVETDAFIAYVRSVLKEIARNGYRLIVIINGHGGNTTAIRVAMKDAAYSSGATFVMFDWWRDAGREALRQLFTSPGHAGEDETSAMLYIDGAHVDMSAARAYPSGWSPGSEGEAGDLKSMRNLMIYVQGVAVESQAVDQALYPYAVLGDPTKASADRGERWLEAVVSEIVERVRGLAGTLGVLPPRP
ncbi:creatininase family protein [Acidilobus sp.]|uniref:creatininase family protein n=1 Tax=Acidilobus sp. TaxID=1872109 RepID=UPI003D05D087